MSRHHMLPPIIYTPQPRPKKIESRKSRIQVRSTGKAKSSGDVDETEEASGLGQRGPVTSKPPRDMETPIEGSERKPKSTPGVLDERTLTVMLAAQEQDQER
jgi:hypothetical protein